MKYLIVSAYGYGNAGDDACALAAAYIASLTDKSHKIKVTSPPIDRALVNWADVVVLGGGGIIYDTIRENVDNYLEYLEGAQAQGKVSIAIGVGVQGIHTTWGKDRYRTVLNKCNLVTTRSHQDTEALKRIGLSNIISTQDLGFLTAKATGFRTYGRFQSVKLNRKAKIALILADPNRLDVFFPALGEHSLPAANRSIDIIEKSLHKLRSIANITIIIQSRDDISLGKLIAKKHGLETFIYKDPNQLTSLLKVLNSSNLIISSRFHGIIFGSLLKRHVVALGFENQKQSKLLTDFPRLADRFYLIEDTASIKRYFTTAIYDDLEKFSKKIFHSNGTKSASVSKIQERVMENIPLVANAIKTQ